jgi:hypothetical protein
MTFQLEIIRKERLRFIELMDTLSIEQLNHIPEGFNNNIAWNFGHIVVVQQMLCYSLAGLPMSIDAVYVEKYRRGTKPDVFIHQNELDVLKAMSVSLIDMFEKDIEKGIFPTNINLFKTLLGVELTTYEQAVLFNTFHEALHYGYAMPLRRAVSKP